MIPDYIQALCRFSPGSDIEVLLSGTSKFYCRVGALELRFVRSVDRGWEFDEVVGPCRVHVEQMNESMYFIAFYDGEQSRVCVDIGAKRAPVRMTGWTEAW